jgi:hypothetical protein
MKHDYRVGHVSGRTAGTTLLPWAKCARKIKCQTRRILSGGLEFHLARRRSRRRRIRRVRCSRYGCGESHNRIACGPLPPEGSLIHTAPRRRSVELPAVCCAHFPHDLLLPVSSSLASNERAQSIGGGIFFRPREANMRVNKCVVEGRRLSDHVLHAVQLVAPGQRLGRL